MNPFDPNNPAGKDLFSGRQSELAEARASFQRTLNNRPDHILVYGPRGMGKTSLINHLAKSFAEQNAIVVFCGIGECNSMDDVVEQFVVRFYERVRAKSESASILQKVQGFFSSIEGISLGSLSVSFTSKDAIRTITPNLSQLLINCWNYVSTEFSSLVIVFDEMDKFSKPDCFDFAKDFVFAIRTAIETIGREEVGKVKFLFSATPEVRSVIEKIHESLLRSLRIIELGVFDQDVIRELLDKGIGASRRSIQYDQSFLAGLTKISDGIPFHVQSICSAVFDADKDGCLSDENLSRGVEKALPKLHQFPFGIWWKEVESWQLARQILLFLAQNNGHATLDQLSEAIGGQRASIPASISNLRRVGFVSPTVVRGEYRLSSILCKIWVTEYLKE